MNELKISEQPNVRKEIDSSVQVLAAGESNEFGGSLPSAMVCPNCGSRLEGRKCKLFCLRTGCGYQVTCAEW